MLHEVNRIMPNMPAGAYQTFRVSAPLRTHWRKATCEEYGCEQYLKGWMTILNESDPIQAKLAHTIRYDLKHSHSWVETKDPSGATCFTFPAGNTCFRVSEHRVKMDKQEHYFVVGGDWRGNPRETRRVHSRPEDWVDEFANNQINIAELIKRG